MMLIFYKKEVTFGGSKSRTVRQWDCCSGALSVVDVVVSTSGLLVVYLCLSNSNKNEGRNPESCYYLTIFSKD